MHNLKKLFWKKRILKRVTPTLTQSFSPFSSILGFYHKLKSSIMGTKVRRPSHAGSWYTDNRKSLKLEFTIHQFRFSFADQVQKISFLFFQSIFPTILPTGLNFFIKKLFDCSEFLPEQWKFSASCSFGSLVSYHSSTSQSERKVSL